MRSHAKAPTAFTFGRKGFAAPALIALALAALFALSFSSSAFAAKKTAFFLGSPTGATGTLGGLFNTPRGVAVNEAGTGGAGVGDIYVVDGNNHRVQQFSASGGFVRAFGRDVVAKSVNEQQRLKVTATAGTYTLTFNGSTTTNIAFNASSATVDNALDVLPSIKNGDVNGDPNVTVSGSAANGYTITFTGSLAAANQPQMSADTTLLTGTATIETLADGIPASSIVGDSNEKQSVTIGGGPTGGTFTLTFGANTTAPIAFNATAAEVKAALEGIASVGAGNVAVTGSDGGPYTVEFIGAKASVDQAQMSADGSGLTPSGTVEVATLQDGASFEICSVAAQCKAGVTGGLGGAMNSPWGIAVNQSTGHLYITDSKNLRVQEFTATGQWVRAWGADVVQPGGVGEQFGANLNERQTVSAKGAFFAITGGTLKLTFDSQTTAAIAFDATGAEVQSALEALSNIGAGNVSVTGPAKGPWTVEFIGTFAGTDVPTMIGDGSQLEAGPAPGVVEITTPQQGGPSPGVEICSIAQQCKVGISSARAGGFASRLVSEVGGGGQLVFLESHLAVAPAGSPNAGNVLVADLNNRRVQEFGSTGAFVKTFGGDVVAGGGTGPEVCTVASECKAGIGGMQLGMFGAAPELEGPGSPTRVAVNSVGKIYATGGDSRFQVFDSSGANPAIFGSAILGVPGGVALGPTGHVFVNQLCPSTSTSDFAIACPGATVQESQIKRLDSSGGFVENVFAGASEFTSHFDGFAANSANDRLYFSTSSGTPGNRVWVLDDKGAQPAPEMTIEPASEITESSAKVSGTVNPNGTHFSTSYRFEVSKNGVGWTSSMANVNLGNGTSPIDVPTAEADGTLAGLEANTFYRVRIIATRNFGAGSAASPELTFLTDGIAPTVVTKYPIRHTDTTALLSADLNPNNLPTAYHFEYGTTTAYGSKAPVPAASTSGGTTRFVFAEVKGLQPATTYHYRLVATNAEGTTKGDDVAFETYAAGAAAKPQRAYEMMTPPFKTVRSPVSFGGRVGNNPNPGVPSLSGEAMLWTTAIFPLTDDVRAAQGGDRRHLERTAEGWTFETQNVLPAKVQAAGVIDPQRGTNFSRTGANASSADLSTVTMTVDNATLLPNEGWGNIIPYTFRKGTGTAGYTAWTTNTDAQVDRESEVSVADTVKLNDEGTAMLRWGGYFNLAEDPSTPWDDDPSGEQLRGVGGSLSAVYLAKSTSPDELPEAPKELVSECTGTGAEATEIPNRLGSGSSSTDTIGAQSCEEAPSTPAATGTGTRTTGSLTLTNVSTDSGAFSVGQFVSGTGIPHGTTITAVGANTLTLSQPLPGVEPICGGAKGDNVTTTAGSPVIVTRPICGTFEAGQAVTGPGIAAGTTILAVDHDRYELTLSANATQSKFTAGDGTSSSQVIASTPSPTALTANAQHVTSRDGAVGGGILRNLIGAVSNDGNRAFFMSPTGAPNTTCSNGTGVNTACPPQLFVRQYDGEGNATVRWISRAQGVGTQRIDLIGRGATFQGASRDGRHVYFQTNAPLVPTDPNGGSSITTGTAQNSSWDLYRYTLPVSLNEDPVNGALLRVTGGPGGTADPNTNDMGDGAGALRYFSDDGRRAYFLTRAEIPGAINNPPKGGSTAPGGTVGNDSTRNLYLFDDTGAAPQWRFIARIPYSTISSTLNPESLNRCASSNMGLGDHIGIQSGQNRNFPRTSCFRGTPDGSGVIFFTRGQLTADDRDQAGDIYLYDAKSDELTRVSAPHNESAEPYSCNRESLSEVGGFCNADLGIKSEGGGGFSAGAGGLETARGWGGGRHYNVGQDAEGRIRVFFESESELVAEDVNGSHMDVYEWSNGRLSLVSPGNTASYSFFSGNSRDGRDVFLFTSARIDPREIDDDDFDLYDVRIGGGFPYTPPPTPCDVLAHECRPNALPAAPPRSAVSSSFNGAGNVQATPKKKARCAKGKVRRKGRCVRKQSTRKKRSQARKKRANSQTGRASR